MQYFWTELYIIQIWKYNNLDNFKTENTINLSTNKTSEKVNGFIWFWKSSINQFKLPWRTQITDLVDQIEHLYLKWEVIDVFFVFHQNNLTMVLILFLNLLLCQIKQISEKSKYSFRKLEPIRLFFQPLQKCFKRSSLTSDRKLKKKWTQFLVR